MNNDDDSSGGPGQIGATYLIAGPAAANPPLMIAIAVVALSILGPFVFLADGTPSLLLGFAAVAVALAGILTTAAAIRAQIRRRADAVVRRRVSITPAGITLHPTPATSGNVQFHWDHIDKVLLTPTSLIIHSRQAGLGSGRHAIRFSKLATPRGNIISALHRLAPDKFTDHMRVD